MDTYERLQPAGLKQVATVEAIFVYNTAMREQMIPRKPLPHPELQEQQTKPLPGLYPAAVSSGRRQGPRDKMNEIPVLLTLLQVKGTSCQR